jgi:dTDP-4-dehydrorhamnose reductase
VFDGTAATDYAEDATTSPINVYGKSKLAGEQALRASGADSLVIRTQWLFGTGGRSLPRTMWERAQAHLESRVVSDQIGRPSYAPDIAKATWQCIGIRARGTLHLANSSSASWYELARRIYAACGQSALIRPCSSSDYPTVARRPPRTVLATRRAEELLGAPLPSWEDAVDRFVLACKDETNA